MKIEALLFYKAVPVKKDLLASLLGVKAEEIEGALEELKERLAGGATRLVLTNQEVELVLAPEFDELVESIRKDELKRDIGKAGAETLAIVLYRSPVTRAEIDRIRGVNSSYILRALETRGLIERSVKAQRNEFIPTTTLMRHLGIGEKTGLSDYANVMNALENFEKQQELEEEAS